MKFGHSGCIMCSYRSDTEWLDMKTSHPDDFELACQYDEMIRHGLPGINGEAYLHGSGVPLREVNFEKLVADKRGGLDLSPHCGGGDCRI